jgi:hypothetical protein
LEFHLNIIHVFMPCEIRVEVVQGIRLSLSCKTPPSMQQQWIFPNDSSLKNHNTHIHTCFSFSFFAKLFKNTKHVSQGLHLLYCLFGSLFLYLNFTIRDSEAKHDRKGTEWVQPPIWGTVLSKLYTEPVHVPWPASGSQLIPRAISLRNSRADIFKSGGAPCMYLEGVQFLYRKIVLYHRRW